MDELSWLKEYRRFLIANGIGGETLRKVENRITHMEYCRNQAKSDGGKS